MGKGTKAAGAALAVALLSGGVMSADLGVDIEYLNAPWQFANPSKWDYDKVKAKLHNRTSMPQKIEGMRFTIPNTPTEIRRTNDPVIKFGGVTDGNGLPRFEMRISGENSTTNQKYNRLAPNSSLALNMEAKGVKKDKDFTPQNPQFLIKTGSFASDKFYKNAPPISLEHLKSLVNNWTPFYDEDLYLLDTLGANGGPVSAGFIDTWYDQEGDSSLFQVQVCIPDKPFEQNGVIARLNLGIMGEKSGDAGPMYAMSLAGEQEIMNVDMQLLIASGTNEKQAGLQEYTYDPITGKPTVLGGSAFIEEQDDQQLGPFNFINTSYKGYIFDCNRKFFPYDATMPSAYFYTATPGMGKKIGGNSPQLVNAALLSSLYYWFLFDGMFNFKNVWVEDIYRRAKDRRIGGKLALNAWRYGFDDDAGFGADILYKDPQVINEPDVNVMMSKTEYLELMDKAMDPLLDANIRSVNNGGTCEIYDDSISLNHLEQFFFGMDGDGLDADGSAGSLGKGGLLWHYAVSTEDRIKMWEDVEAAFNFLKRKAPSTKNLTGDYISFRYDFLGVLRVARQYFDIERPMPSGIEFDRFVKKHAIPDVVSGKSGKKIEGIYPYLVKDDRYFDNDDNFIIKINATDETYLNIDSAAVVEWTLNNELLGWAPAKHVSGDTLASIYEVTVPAEDIKNAFGDKGGIGWVRVTDRNFNSTVDTFSIEGVKYPRITSAAAKDNDGDGVADSIVVKMRLGQADGAFALDSWSKCRYAWPNITSVTEKTESEIGQYDLTNSIIMLVDRDLTGGAGLGAVEFDYPEDNIVKANVLDSVGPAISSAITPLESSRVLDTLLITVSEELAAIDKTDHLYCLFKKGNNESEIAAKSFIYDSGLGYKVLFDKNTIIDMDSVRFAYNIDPVEDAVGNKPVDYNQWVPLAKDGGKVPTSSKAEMFDINGDGDGDSINVEMEIGSHTDAYTVDDINGGLFNWPSTMPDKSYSSGDVNKKDKSTFWLSHPSDKGKGIGNISIDFPENVTIKSAISDKVGPALKAASLSITDVDRDNDTLLVEVSEELSAYNKKDHAYLLFDDESGAVKSDSIIKVSDNAYKVVFPKASIHDKNRVKFVHKGETVEDTYENKPMDINQWIDLEVIGGKAPSLKRAEVFDTKGDGIGDSVRVELALGSAVDRYDYDDLSGGFYHWPISSSIKTVEKGDHYDKSEDAFSFDYNSGASAGTGKIELEFPEGTTVAGPINDKVGPVIDKAICLQQDEGRDKDTLVLTTSEELEDNFSDETKYIIIFEKKADSEGDTLKVESFTEDGGEYKLVVAKSAIEYGDWIQFNYDSGIKDKADNAPLKINQKILINVKGGVAPNITTADIYDVKGDSNDRLDGNGDSIFVKLELAEDPKALTVDSLKSVEYSWGGDTESKDLDDLIRISDSEFAIVDESLKGGSGAGTVKLVFKNDGYDVTGSINDKVAPVIKSVDYYDWSTVNDTFTVTYSEELDKAGTRDALMKSETKDIEVKVQNHSGATVTYSLESGGDLVKGDSLWIQGKEEVEDSEGNEQKTDDNVRVLINYNRVSTLERAEYRESDSRPDGYIDEIVLTFDATLDESVLEAVKEKVTLPAERHFTIDGARVDDDQIILEVSQDDDQVAPNTAVEEYDRLDLDYAKGSKNLVCVAEGTFDINDKLAPVLVSARFTPGSSENEDGNIIDELTVTYSEKVKELNRDEPFTLSDASDNDDEYSLDLHGDAKGKEGVRYFSTYRSGDVLPGLGDMIWISDVGQIEDTEGNMQEENTKPVELIVDKYDRGYDVVVTPTPYEVAFFEEDSIAVIRILPESRALPDNIKAQCVIYDKVGNVIRKVSRADFGEVRDGQLTFGFIPKNENGRRLGEGAYAVEFLIETDDAEPASERAYLFIKGEQPGKKDDDKDKDKDKDDE